MPISDANLLMWRSVLTFPEPIDVISEHNIQLVVILLLSESFYGLQLYSDANHVLDERVWIKRWQPL